MQQNAGLDGLWLQMDDYNGRPRSIIRMRAEGKRVTGVVEEIFRPSGSNEPRCNSCLGNNAGKPITGMQILSVSQTAAGEWDGEIFDPASGRNYKCRLELAPGGVLLNVRAFIAISMIGRSQRWLRYGSL